MIWRPLWAIERTLFPKQDKKKKKEKETDRLVVICRDTGRYE
jgi:hypothetical protein